MAGILQVISILFLVTAPATADRILMILYQQPSHVLMKAAIAEELIGQGHEVYIALATSYPGRHAVEQVGMMIVDYNPAPDVLYPFAPQFEDRIADFIFNNTDIPGTMYAQVVEADCNAMASNSGFLETLKKLTFDLVVVEPFIANPCYLLIPHVIGVRYVSASALVIPLAMGLPALPSFYVMPIVNQNNVVIPELDTLVDRLRNVWSAIFYRISVQSVLWENTTLLSKHTLRAESWYELLLKSELIIIENDHHLDNALPLLPHVVVAPGCTVLPAKRLPSELEAVFDQSGEAGVILASFGTTAHRMPEQLTSLILAAFAQLEETVVTRLTVSEAQQVPPNVKLLPWLPQNDILGHPKTKLFITHCGANSQYEALYHGIPMLGIPMFAEQSWNCARAKRKGISLCLDLFGFTVEQFHRTVRELIDNATYTSKIRQMSAIWRDEPMIGRKKAAFWINHVIKYGGDHLTSPAVNQSVLALLMLDAVALHVSLIICIVACLTMLAARFMPFVTHRLNGVVKAFCRIKYKTN